MAKLQNSSLPTALAALRILAERKLPVRVALKVTKLTRELNIAWEDVDKVRRSLVDEYTEKDESGDPVTGQSADGQSVVKIVEDKLEEFGVAWTELLTGEVEFQTTISVSEFGDAFEVEPSILIDLGDLLVE